MIGVFSKSKAPLATRERWQGIVAQYAAPVPPPPVRRKHPRYDADGRARVDSTGDSAGGRAAAVHCRVLQISAEGLTLRSPEAIAQHTQLEIELHLDEHIVLLHGRVVHCTQSVGAMKIGIQLMFDDTRAGDDPDMEARVEVRAEAPKRSGVSSDAPANTPPRLRRLVVAHLRGEPW
jgi:hypothetical protein